MASLAAQLAEFKRRVFGAHSQALAALQPELWLQFVRLNLVVIRILFVCRDRIGRFVHEAR